MQEWIKEDKRVKKNRSQAAKTKTETPQDTTCYLTRTIFASLLSRGVYRPTILLCTCKLQVYIDKTRSYWSLYIKWATSGSRRSINTVAMTILLGEIVFFLVSTRMLPWRHCTQQSTKLFTWTKKTVNKPYSINYGNKLDRHQTNIKRNNTSWS